MHDVESIRIQTKQNDRDIFCYLSKNVLVLYFQCGRKKWVSVYIKDFIECKVREVESSLYDQEKGFS